jgi:hypothetical protein
LKDEYEPTYSIKEELQKKLNNAKIELNSTLCIIEKQKFKRILRNKGTFTFTPKILVYVFIFHCLIYITVCVVSLLEKNLEIVINTNFYNVILVFVFLLNISEFTLIPMLVCFTLRRKYYFDYQGEVDRWKYEGF